MTLPNDWRTIDPSKGRDLSDARRQLHHAAQFGAALGISYLEKRPDDSHTNLEWIASLGALASNRAGQEETRVAVGVVPFALLVLDASNRPLAEFALEGRTMAEAELWLRGQLGDCGMNPARFTMTRHYTIPSHAVADGEPFSGTAHDAFAELASWYGDAAAYFTDLSTRVRHPSTVRCWPHHFDIGMLFEPAAGTSIGIGMEPGDNYYAEPYWYANVYPGLSSAADLPALDGDGTWHTEEWIGAVLTAAAMHTTDQPAQVAAFFESAFRAYGASS